MIVRGKDFDDIYDLVALRVIVDTVQDCYAVLGSLHSRWTPMSGRFKDYIAVPKFNLYQSLHTTVVGRAVNRWRSRSVPMRCTVWPSTAWPRTGATGGPQRLGSKRRGGRLGDSDQGDMGWLRQLVDWQKETQDPSEFLDALRYEMAGDQVYVFTPKGDVLALPAGATPVDFAYAVHTEVGHRTVGARVNSRLVPLDTRLENGDTVEVFTSKAIS